MSKRTRYGFETVLTRTKNKPYGDDDDFYKRFCRNLKLNCEGTEPPVLGEGDKALLNRYVANVHVNCSWYNGKVRQEKLYQTLFFFISISLLVFVPILIYFSPYLFKMGAKALFPGAKFASESQDETSARLATLLAGFFAAHRALAAWLNQRKLIGPYWKGRSDLLNEIYTLETTWGPKTETEKVVNEEGRDRRMTEKFQEAIETSLETARAAIQAERTQFYENYTFPDIKLSESLSTASAKAASLVTSFESASVKKQRELAKARAAHAKKYDELKADVNGITAKLEQLGVDLKEKKDDLSRASDSDKVKALQKEVEAMVKEASTLKTQRRSKIQEQEQERVRAGLV